MATAGSTNKSAFLRDLLGKKPDLKPEQATEAWQEAGNEGEIGSSLYYNVKRELKGGAGPEVEPAPKPKAKAASKGAKGKQATQAAGETRKEINGETAPASAVGSPRSGDRERVLDRVEDGIDDLIIELKRLGGMEEALEAMRKVRRVVVRSHGG